MNALVTQMFLRTLPFSFYLKIFPLSLLPSIRSLYHLGNSMRRVLTNSYMNRKVELCEMNARVTQTFLRSLPFSFYVKIFPFSLQPSMRSQISLCRFHEKNVSKQQHEQKCGALRDVCMSNTLVSQNSSFQFLSEDISFVTVALNELPKITQQIP